MCIKTDKLGSETESVHIPIKAFTFFSFSPSFDGRKKINPDAHSKHLEDHFG